jgi:amino acid adenylation domain-containing protein
MEVHEIITRLTTNGARIEVVDDQLKINVNRDIITPELQALIRNNKREIIDFIGRRNDGIRPVAGKKYYALSSQQKRMYFLYQFDESKLTYNESAVYNLRGQLDHERLRQAFSKLVARHEILRTSFHVVDGEPMQTVAQQLDFDIEYYSNKENIDELIKEFVRPFDLAEPPLLRVALVVINEQEHLLMVDLHHIITDGVSKGILVKDFMSFYNHEQLPALPLHYKDFAEWQQSPARQQLLLKQRAFWQQMFPEVPATADLPFDFERPAAKTYAGRCVSFELDAATMSALASIAASQHTTMYMVLLSVYVIFLGKLSNQEDIVLGTPTAGRQHADVEKMMGLFVNTMALRHVPKGEMSFAEFLADVKDRSVACFDNQDYPYELLIDDLRVVRDPGRNPLFDAFFMFHNFERFELVIPGLQLTYQERAYAISKFDITLEVIQSADGIAMKFEYSTDLFKASTIDRFIAYFRRIISTVTANPATKICDIDILSDEEHRLLLKDFNDTYLDYPRETTIVSLFEQQVLFSKDKVAVISGGRELSYDELNRQANAIAFHLRNAEQLETGSLVGLLLERDEWLMPCLLAVLKAGAGYVPIDPSYPLERIKYVAENSGVKLLLTLPSLIQQHPLLSEVAKMVDVTSIDLSPSENAAVPVDENALAYMIYTSGSTGLPKGVMITHKSVINFIQGAKKAISFGSGARVLCITTISFDIFVLESIFPLLNGMTMVLATAADQKDPHSLVQLVKKTGVDCIQMTPSHIKLLVNSGRGSEALQQIKTLMIGGEALPEELVDELQKHYNGKIFNLYGPTETTVYSCIGQAKPGERVTIGKPIANTVIRVLDRHNKLVPINVPGELCIGGEGVSKGYWRRPELTAEKFVRDPYGKGHLYRTGDVARWRWDGQVLCLGRIDQQVKIRGHRIELGEIEAQLNKHDDITRSAVDVKGQGSDKYLVAYYESETEIEPGILQAHLSRVLPMYMVPGRFMHLNKLPLTPNGKLDRKALPHVELQAGNDYVAPANATEERLQQLWAEALHIDPSLVGVTRNFFELGGHSLRAIYLVDKIEQSFGVRIGIRQVFENITVRKLGQIIATHRKEALPVIPKADKRKYYPASSAQERLYYQQLLNPERVTSNIPMVLRLKGKWSKERLQQSFQALVNLHDSLRTSFSIEEEGVVQQVHENVTIEVVDNATYERFIRPFDLSQCPLMRCGLFYRENETYLIVDVHHIICDALSLNILMTDFKNIYKGNMPSPPSISYVDYACWQRTHNDHLQSQEKFWMQQLSGNLPRLDLPTLRSRETTDIYHGDTQVMTISDETFRQLKKYTAAANASTFMFFLSAYYLLLSKLSGNNDIIIGTDALGRSVPQLRNVTGTFINVLPLRLQVEGSFNDLLPRVKHLVLAAFENQDYQYDQMCALVSTGERRKIVDVYFSDANLFENEVQLDELEFVPANISTGATTTRYELELRIDERADHVSVTFLYSTDLYDAATIGLFVQHYKNIIHQALIS